MPGCPSSSATTSTFVLMGHDHTYARGYVNADATATLGVTTGPVYVVAVRVRSTTSSSRSMTTSGRRTGPRGRARRLHLHLPGIRVTDDQLFYEAIVAAKWDDQSTTDVPVGGVLDSWSITKASTTGTKAP